MGGGKTFLLQRKHKTGDEIVGSSSFHVDFHTNGLARVRDHKKFIG